jgi:hypothetical protein
MQRNTEAVMWNYVVCLGVYDRGVNQRWLAMGSVRVQCVVVVRVSWQFRTLFPIPFKI